MTEQRRLAAILVVDVVGYSKLIGSDEAGTLAQLKALRSEIIEPQLAKHAGRLFKSVGDGFLIEFASAVQAVSCAQAIQDANAAGRLPLRIGIHVGDVVVQGDDLMGDAANIAARIEGVAEPGGIALSRAVHEQVRDKLDISFSEKGKIELKNIARPVQVFVVGDAKASSLLSALPLPDKPSIAVLPFQNMSGDHEQEYFVDGLVEDIITALSRFRSLFVIARNSSFAYKGKSPDVRQVGRELGVRYVLEGSVRRSGNRMRITCQLIDADNGAHLWADRFEGSLEDVFELQDNVTETVVGIIAPKIDQAEVRRAQGKSVGSLRGYDLLLRSLAQIRSGGRTDLEQAIDALRQVVASEPTYARAFVHLSRACLLYVSQGFAHRNEPLVGDLVQTAQRAIALDSQDSEVLAIAAFVLGLAGGDMDTAIALLDQAIVLNSNNADAYRIVGTMHGYLGHVDKALEHQRHAERLNPLDSGPVVNIGYTIAHFGVLAHEAVLDSTARILRERPNAAPALRYRAASLALLGRIDEARVAVSQILALTPGYTLAELRRHQEFDMNKPFKQPGVTEALYEGLRLAGLPE